MIDNFIPANKNTRTVTSPCVVCKFLIGLMPDGLVERGGFGSGGFGSGGTVDVHAAAFAVKADAAVGEGEDGVVLAEADVGSGDPLGAALA